MADVPLAEKLPVAEGVRLAFDSTSTMSTAYDPLGNLRSRESTVSPDGMSATPTPADRPPAAASVTFIEGVSGRGKGGSFLRAGEK